MRWQGWLLFTTVFVVIFGLIGHDNLAGSGDDAHYLVVAHSVAFDRDLDLANDYASASLIGSDLRPDAHAARDRGHVLRPLHDIGLPLLAAPFVGPLYAAAERLGEMAPAWIARRGLTPATLFRAEVSMWMALLAAWLSVELSRLLREHGVGGHLWWALLIVLSPPLLSYAFLFLTELPSALLVTILFRHIVSPGVRRRRPWLAGVLTGALLLLDARNIGLVIGFGALGVATWRRERRALAAFLAPLAAVIALRTAVNYRLWGMWVANPRVASSEIDPAALIGEPFFRLAGLLFDQEFGLFPYAPLYLLVPLGLWILRRSRRTELRPLLIVVGTYLLLVLTPLTNTHGWRGGWAPPARFLVPICPLLGYAVAAGVWGERARLRAMVIPLVAVQVTIDAVIWRDPALLWNLGDGAGKLAARLPASLGEWLPALQGHHAALLPFIIAAFIWFGGSYLATRRLRRTPQPEQGLHPR